MPISGYFDQVFGNDGTLAAIPDALQSDGSVSYNQGWGIDYTLPSSNPSYKYMPWGQFNQLFYDITSAIQNWQQNTVAPFITSTMNGGSAYSYPAYAMVLYSGVVYISNTGSNTDTPPSSKWTALPLSFTAGNLYTGGTTTGSANAQVLASLSPASGFSLSNPGDTITCTAGYTNTGATTVAITSPSISATPLRKNGPSGLTALTGGEIIAGNIITLTVDASSTYLVLDAGLPASLFLQQANNLSDVASAATSRTNLGAAASGANTDITSLQGSALIFTNLGVGSIIPAYSTTTGFVAGSSYAASALVPSIIALSASGGGENSGDTITGTWRATLSTSGSGNIDLVTIFQRIA